jgi:hypothetical protein
MMHTCPVCGYPALAEPPRSRSGGGSYEICPSCGFEFGVTDDDRGFSYAEWRQRWVESGMPWSSEGIEPHPTDWDPGAQLHAAPVLSQRDDEPFHTCPVCGYRRLFNEPWLDDNPSDEICPCCGTHFGSDDARGVDEASRRIVHAELRTRWVASGCEWWSSEPPPPGWDPQQQLATVS